MAFDKGEWKPTRKQEIFLSLPITIKEAGYGGGAGSAKTDVLLVYPLVHRWHEHPAFKQVFMRRTFPELRNEIIPRSRQIYSKFGATLNKSDMAWTFPRPDEFGGSGKRSGAMIFLGQCEDEEDVHKYDSMEINLFTPDEITSFTEYIYLYIGFTRTRTSYKDLPAIIRTAGMPGGIGHTWFKKRFVDPSPPPNDRKIIIGRGGNKRIYIHATVRDNPHIDPVYIQSLEALPEAEKRAKLYGDWDAYLGSVFEEFRDKKYPDEPENALHVIEPFEIPDWWPKFIVGDWGYRAKSWIGYAAVSPNKRVYIYREQVWQKVKIAEWAPFVKENIEKENPRFIRFCKSAGQDRGQEHTIQQQISEALGVDVELTDNSSGSRISTKNLLHEYLRWKPKPILTKEQIGSYSEEIAMRILRMRGMKEYESYCNMFIPNVEEEVIPKLQIFNTCPEVITAIKNATYDKPKKDKPAEDVKEWDGDDPYDGVRYIVQAADKFFEEAKEEFEKVQMRQAITEKYAGKDWTAFYHNARIMDSSDRKQFGISRYHRR